MTARTSPLIRLAGSITTVHAGAHTEYQTRPLDWIVEKLGVPRHTLDWVLNQGYETHEWDGTPDPMARILDALAAHRNVGVESATTTGKTFLGGCIVLWFIACHENGLVVTVAPKKDQLTLHIWKEISRLWPRFQQHFPNAEKDSLRIRMVPGSDVWSAHGFVAGVKAEEVEGSATKAQGFHAEHMLIVFEETPGIAPAIMTAFKNTCRAPHNLRLAFGNPDHQGDELHRFCTREARVEHVVISAYDHPNVVCGDASIIPGAVSQQGIDDALHDAKDDGGQDNRMFKSRVRGISPKESANALIRWDWCEAAALRWTQAGQGGLRSGRVAKGVDVANSVSGDKAAVATWDGACLDTVRAFGCPNATMLGTDVHGEMLRELVPPEHVGVDPVGVGAATINELHRLTKCYLVQGLNGGLRPVERAQKAPDGTTYDWAPDANAFANLRAQMWWQLREDLRLGVVALPRDTQLFRELTTPTFEPKGGKVYVEEKTTIKERLGRSPDRADAVVYGNWVRPRAQITVPEEPKRPSGQDPWVIQPGEQQAEWVYVTPEDGNGFLQQYPAGF